MKLFYEGPLLIKLKNTKKIQKKYKKKEQKKKRKAYSLNTWHMPSPIQSSGRGSTVNIKIMMELEKQY